MVVFISLEYLNKGPCVAGDRHVIRSETFSSGACYYSETPAYSFQPSFARKLVLRDVLVFDDESHLQSSITDRRFVFKTQFHQHDAGARAVSASGNR